MDPVETYISNRLHEDSEQGFLLLAGEAASACNVSMNDAVDAMVSVLIGETDA